MNLLRRMIQYSHVRRTFLLVVYGLLLTGFLQRVTAQSCDFYVNPSDGSDSNLGTQFQPVQSLETGFSRARSGQRICAAAGEYFGGSDSDGVALRGTNKSVTVVLTSFANNHQFVFSEKEFLVDIGSGTLSFEFSGSESVYFGLGQLNTDSLFPGGSNFLHSFSILSGRVQFGSVPVLFGESVGNPNYVNPNNSSKVAPLSAGIHLNGTLDGNNLTYAQAPRSWMISGGIAGVIRTVKISSLVSNSSLVFSNTGPVQISNVVSVSAGSTVVVSSASNSKISFTSGITLKAGAKITHSGSDELTLNLNAPDKGDMFVESSGSGKLQIENLTNATEAVLHLSAKSGSISLNSPMTFKGSVDIRSVLEINADVTIDLNSSSVPAFSVSGALIHGSNNLTLRHQLATSAKLDIQNNASFSGGPIKLKGFVELSGGGKGAFTGLDPFRIESSDVSFSDSIRVGIGSSLGLNSSMSRIEGTLFVSGGSVQVRTDQVFLSHFEMSDGELQPNGASVHVLGRFTAAGGTINNPDLIFTSSASGYVKTNSPIGSLKLYNSSIEAVGTILSVGGCVLEESTLLVANEGSVACSTIETFQQSNVRLGTRSRLESTHTFDLSEASLQTQPGSRLIVGGNLILGSASPYDTGNSSISWTGKAQSFESPTSTSWLGFDWTSTDASLDLIGEVYLHSDLTLNNPTVLLSDRSVLRLRGNLEVSPGHFSFSESSVLVLEGGTVRSSSLGSTILLPSTQIYNNTTLNSNFSVNGTLSLLGGMFTIFDTLKGRVSGNIISNGGGLTLKPRSALTIDGSTSLASGTVLLFPQSVFEVQNEVALGSASPYLFQGVLRFIGDATINFGNVLRTGTIEVASNAKVELQLDNLKLETDALSVGAEAVFHLRNGSVTVGSQGKSTNLFIEGIVSGSLGSEVVLEGSGGIITGGGQLTNVVLNLDSDSSMMILKSDSFLLNQSIIFRSGILAVESQNLRFGTATSFQLTVPIRADKFISNFVFSPSTVVNPDSVPLSIFLAGEVSSFLSMETFLTLGPISNLTISAADALNSPPVFGLVSEAPIVIFESLSLAENTLLKSPSVTIQSNNTNSVIAGTIENLTVRGSGTISGKGTGILGSFLHDSGSLTISNVSTIESMSLSDAQLSLDGQRDVKVLNSISANASTLNINVQAHLKSALQDVSFNLTNSQLRFDENGGLIFESPSKVWIDGDSDVSVHPGGGGEIFFLSEASLTVSPPVPRLVISGPASKITLNSNLTVSDQLFSTKGSMDLGTWNLTFNSATWSYDGTRVFSNQSSGNSTVAFSGVSQMLLYADFLLENTSLTVEAELGPLSIHSPSSVSRNITLQNGQLLVRNGILDLASNDILVQGNRQPVITLSSAEIIGSVQYPALDWDSRLNLPSQTFPFSSDQIGEVVVDSPSGSLIKSDGINSISAMRIEKAVSLPSDNSPIQVTKRFSFGYQNASVNMNKAGALVFASGAQLIRRGSGVLSHEPTFLGPSSVGYNLDDGSSNWPASVFFQDELITGFEIPPQDIGVDHLLVLGGNAGSQIHTVKLNQNLRVLGSLSVLSGTFNQADKDIVFENGSALALLELDQQAPSTYASIKPYSVSGKFDLLVRAITPSKVLSQAFYPGNVPVQRFDLDVGSSQAGTSSRVFLHGDRQAERIHIFTSTGSSFNLFGSALSASDTLLVGRGMVTSDQFSVLKAGNYFALSKNASIAGNISVEAVGNSLLEGNFSALSFQSSGDIVMGGTFGVSTSIRLNGLNQVVSFQTNELSFSELTIDSESQDGETIFSGPANSLIKVTRQLTLNSGRLNSGVSSILLQPSSKITNTASSWLLGTVKRSVTTGFTGEIQFPVGTTDASHPIALTFPSPLLSSTLLSLTVVEKEPLIKSGLPIQVGESLVQDTDSFFWKLTSSVNFGSAQPFSLSSVLEASSVQKLVLLTKQVGKVLEPWKSGPNRSDLKISSGVLNSGLSPLGLRITPGISSRNSDWSFVQFFDDWSATSLIDVDIFLNDELWISNVKPGETTPIIPLAQPQNGLLSVSASQYNQDPIQNIVANEAVLLQAGSLSRLVLAQNTLSTPNILASEPISKGQGVQGLYLTTNDDFLDLSQSSPSVIPVFSRMARNIYASSSASLDQSAVIKVASDAGGVSYSKFSSLPAGIFPNLILVNADLSVLVLGNDGTVSSGVVTTNVLEKPDVPIEFSIDSIFPNPARTFATVVFSVGYPGPILIELFDVLGQNVFSKTLIETDSKANLTFRLDTSMLASGSYFLRVSSGNITKTKTLTVIH